VESSELVERVQELLDRKAILDCLQRYARGIDRHDADLVASCYHPDAVDDHGLYVGSGRGLAEWANNEAHRGSIRHQHHLTNHSVEIDGDTAHAETYYLVVMRSESGAVTLGSGRYLDRFERRAGEWRIAARVVIVETSSDLGASDMSDLDRAFAPPAQDHSDPSYQRPLVVRRRSAEDPHPVPSGIG
jgi:ketosteroid isomerase-like protein